jgi:PTS system nitrogen regulatory IIA component
MQLSEFLSTDSVLPTVKAPNKRQLLQDLANHAAKRTGLDARRIFDVLLQRERLLTTGLGQGTAIPHGKFADLGRVHGLFAKLVHPVDFKSVDEQPVDLVFLLLSPEAASGDHLMALARVSRLFRDPHIVAKLRGTEDAEGLYAILTEPAHSASHAA